MKLNITLSEQTILSLNVTGRGWLPLGFKIKFKITFHFLTYLPSQCTNIGLKFGIVHKNSTCESSSLVINKAQIRFNKHLNVHNRDM